MLDKRVMDELDKRRKGVREKYAALRKNYAPDYPECKNLLLEYVYYSHYWILFANGLKEVWFTPWYFFKDTPNFESWCNLVKENVRSCREYLDHN